MSSSNVISSGQQQQQPYQQSSQSEMPSSTSTGMYSSDTMGTSQRQGQSSRVSGMEGERQSGIQSSDVGPIGQQQSGFGTQQGVSGSSAFKETIPSIVQETAQQQISQQGGPTSLHAQQPQPVVSRFAAPGQLKFMRTVLVTGATGSTGCALLTFMSTFPARNFNIFVGAHGDVNQKCQQLFNQCEKVLNLDANIPTSLDFSGVDELVIIPPNTENRVEQVQNYVTAAKESNVKFITLLSVLGTETSTFDNLFTQQFRRMEDVVEQSNIPCCFLRCNLYMENLYLQAFPIKAMNSVMLPLNQGRWAPIAVNDVAKVLFAIVNQPEPHINKAYDLSGPELLNGQQIARHLSQHVSGQQQQQPISSTSSQQQQQPQSIYAQSTSNVGQQLDFCPCTLQQFVDILMVQKLPQWLATGLADYLDMFENNRNYDSINSQDFFNDLTGDRMITLSNWCQLNSQELNHLINKIPNSDIEQWKTRQPQFQQQQVQPQGVGAVGGIGGTDETMSQLKHLLQELIDERSDFTNEERRMIDRNERRLQQLHQLGKQIGGVGGIQGQQQPISAQQGLGKQQQQPISSQQGIGQQQPERGLREAGIAGGRGMGYGQQGGVSEGGLGGPGMAQKLQSYGQPLGVRQKQQAGIVGSSGLSGQGMGGGYGQSLSSGQSMGQGMMSSGQQYGGGYQQSQQPMQQQSQPEFYASSGW